jgi:hypothetical protein
VDHRRGQFECTGIWWTTGGDGGRYWVDRESVPDVLHVCGDD